ncbi:FAD-dependent oxidoreductase [Polynucleobacter sp. HIN6]|uniref:NAD(P)-binding protein n=1 Tax=Polynucleobacter sp. HIN6 TaxID=3047865 RepID=UPI0025727099|nr:NAD(P)-binding protein [Polynucleobacter sp. HIN6]BEI34790.1 FAD-dependent oxidoreductase [Polynucleobacter sp. HIN6]
MKNFKFIILGGGPSGLSFANALINNGISPSDFLLLEKNSNVGGLCRSEMIDGSPLDIGGGHFLDVRRQNVLDFLFRFMPAEEWLLHERISKIRIRGVEIDHPLEANLWQFPTETQIDYLESIAQAGCVSGDQEPRSFAKWITWKFGERISKDYMLPYNRKIWSMDPDFLGTYWLYKLPNVSFRETLLSCLEAKPTGSLPAHGKFLYPKEFGYGEVWRRMGKFLGDSLITNYSIKSIDINNHVINDEFHYENLITSIPWIYWKKYCILPTEIVDAINLLKNASIDIDYIPETLDNDSHWIYEPNESITYHRILLRANFISGSRGYWTETNAKRSSILGKSDIRFHNEFAYPINTIEKPEAVRKILAWAKNHSVVGLGRWGTWEHMNSDVAVDQALRLAHDLCHGALP